jgi:uncharacterized membrane protein YkoI
MNRRLFSVVLLSILCATVTLPSFAKDGNSGEDGSGDDDHGDDDGGDDDKGDDNGDDNPGGPGGGDSGGDHDDAKDAVDANEVLPLRQILALLRKRANYTVIDVKLYRGNGAVLYILKCIEESGAVVKIVFDAKTGAVVE